MLFNSFEFIYLVLATFALYYFPATRRLQVYILILASFVFYCSHEPVLTMLLAFSIAINISCSHLIRHGNPRRQVIYAATGVIINLALLAFFKYSPLFAKTFLADDSSLAETLYLIPLPIGISFFTFQGITLLVDTLRNRRHDTDYELADHILYRHSLHTTLYVAFFPATGRRTDCQGARLHSTNPHKKFQPYRLGLLLSQAGCRLFSKNGDPDNLKDYTFWIAYPYFEGKSSLVLLVMLFGYSIQIFADFAGYSLIAIGIAGLFGYYLPKNFNFSYISSSITEFWRRWHISLSSLLKEYLYFPLGGNRKGRLRTYLNLMIVMLHGGLWHGAAWSHMVWGGVHGIALSLERFAGQYITLPDNIIVKLARTLSVFVFASFAWLLF